MRIRNLGIKSAALIFLTIGAIVIFAFYFKTAGGTLPFSRSAYVVNVYIADPQDLLDHADVDSAGVHVGQVYKVENTTINGVTYAHAIVHLNAVLTPIYKNATYIVRQKSLVGENYLQIDRGTPSAGAVPNNGALPPSHDQDGVSLDVLLNAVDPTTRKDLGTTFRSLGAGLDGQGQNLNTVLGALQPTVDSGALVFSALAQQKHEVADVVQQAGTVFQALANRTGDLRTLVTAAKSTAQAVAARDAAFRDAFGQFPSTLSQARSTLTNVSSFSTQATPVIGNLSTAMRSLQPVVQELGPTARSTRTLFNELQPLITQANPLLTNLNSFSNNAQGTFPALTNLWLQADPALDYLKPYYADLSSFFANFGAGSFANKYGRALTCGCPVSAESLADYTPAEKAALNALLGAGLFHLIDGVQNNGLKPPGGLDKGVGATTGAGLHYPQIQAAAPGSAG